MSFSEFEEWLEEKHPEHMVLMDEFTQDMNAQYRVQQEIWGKYLDKHGKEEKCPNCEHTIFYIMPESWDMTEEGCSLYMPCLNCPTILAISNHKGELKKEFILVTKLGIASDTEKNTNKVE